MARHAPAARRLHRVPEKRLSGSPCLAGDGDRIADRAAFPWIGFREGPGIDLDHSPAVKRWHDAGVAWLGWRKINAARR
jgi:glutathione S-transferase